MNEIQSLTWTAIAAWANEQIESLRKQNDAPQTPDETAALRGQIRALKRLLALPEELAQKSIKPSLEESDDQF